MSAHTVEVGRWGAPFQRRKHARIPATLPIRYRVVAVPESPSVPPAASVRPGPRVRETVATSVGSGGLRLATGERIPVGSRLAVVFDLPTSSLNRTLVPVTVEARVVWTDIVSDDAPDTYHCGVEFLDLEPAARRSLVAFIQGCEVAEIV
jgi:c-di-GMP-binding flagellar brake protein YcgR